MSNSKKKRDAAKQRHELRRKRKRERLAKAATNVSLVKPDIHREIQYITRLAQAEDSRIVKLANLVLFSTRTRDAWLLDPDDAFAVCLCRDGEPQPFQIIDAPRTFAIDWTAKFTIEGEVFVVQEKSGRVIAINDYPTAEIAAACRG
jgi:hypothetical protein